MPEQISPTKANLLLAKKNLQLAKQGYEMLDRKRNILMREMMKLIDESSKLQRDVGNTFSEAYSALEEANVTLGIETIMKNTAPEEDGFKMENRTVMGVNLPTTWRDAADEVPFYGFWQTNSFLDNAYVKFETVKDLTARLAGVENSTYRLATAIKKTQRRANMLKNIVIPRYEASIRYISGILEEHDREEFTRLKVIKHSKAKKSMLQASDE